MIERETYSALEWLDDVGGLFYGLWCLIAHIIVGPITALMIKSQLLRLFNKVLIDESRQDYKLQK